MAERELRFAPKDGATVWGPDGGVVGIVLSTKTDPSTEDLTVTFRAKVDGEYQTFEATYSRQGPAGRSLLGWKVLDGPVSEPDESVSS